ncbi:MAG: DNA polymerase III subunit gamma/tau [Firmicutes bacterium]|nr:DNA polymerase III subunit gamma/tau [Bacillota bacterium]
MDVQELDAASNRGIDEVRDLREKTRYVATQGDYKVYIIDEVHMLTHEAFNALLKTLEEPPPGVIFILATTDPSRLPSTVISRCQRLDFRLLTLEEIKERMAEVSRMEDWSFEEEALWLIARLSEGAMRDALGLLEQAYALGEGKVMAENVYILTGLAREEAVGRVVEALVKEDIVGGLAAAREIAFGGKDLYLFLREQIIFFKQLLVAQSAGLEALEDKRYEKYLKQYSNIFSDDVLLEMISLLHETTGEIRFSEHAYFVLETLFLHMLKVAKSNAMDKSMKRLMQRIEKLEKRSASVEAEQRPPDQDVGSHGDEKNGKMATDVELAGESAVEKSPRMDETEKVTPSSGDVPAVGDFFSSADKLHAAIIGLLKDKKKGISTLALLEMVHPVSLTREVLTLSYDRNLDFLEGKLTEPGRLKLLEEVAAQLVGRKIRIKFEPRVSSRDGEEDRTGSSDRTPESKLERELPPDPGKTEPAVTSAAEKSHSAGKEAEGSRSSFSKKVKAGDDLILNEALKLFEGKIIESEN